MTSSALESCVAAVARQIRQVRGQYRPQPAQLRLRIDRLLWRCSQDLPLDRFQAVYDQVADPLSTVHGRIRDLARARHGHIDSLLAAALSPAQVVAWSARSPDMAPLYRIWTERSPAIKQDPTALWHLAIVLSGRPDTDVGVLADVLVAVADRERDGGDRLAQFLYDCVLRYSGRAGPGPGAALCRILQDGIGARRLATELGLLLVKDARCGGDRAFVRQSVDWFRPALSGQVPDRDRRVVQCLRSMGLLDEALARVRPAKTP